MDSKLIERKIKIDRKAQVFHMVLRPKEGLFINVDVLTDAMATKLIDRHGRKHVASSAMPDHIHVLIECEGIQDIDIVEFIAFVDRILGEHRREIAVIMIPPPFQMYATVFVTLNKLLHEEGMTFERELNLMFPGIGDVFMPDEFDIDTGFSPDQTIN